MAFKIIIGVLMIALCALSGRAAAMKSVYEADGIRKLQEDVLYLKTLTLHKKQLAAHALSRLKEPVFKRMSEYMNEEMSLSVKEAWVKAAEVENVGMDARKIMEMLFDAAESLTRDEQEAQYGRTRDDLKRLEQQKRKAGMERVKLYTSLGAVAGVCALIFCL